MPSSRIIVPFAALLIWAAGCDQKNAATGGAPATQKVTLLLDWKPEPEFGGFYAARLNGAFGKKGLDVEMTTAGEGANVWQLVAAGKADFATTAADQVLIARANGADVVAIFAVYQTSPQGIMVHPGRGFTKIADVFGSPGTLAAEDNAWLKFCEGKFGPPKVTLTSYSGGVAAFLAKPDYSQQCFVTSEPLLAKKQGGDPRTFLVADAGYNPYTTVIITSRKMVSNQPEVVRAMVTACREGWRAYLEDPKVANAEMHKLNGDMDLETFAAVAELQKPLIETDATKAAGLGTMTEERWSTLGRQLLDLKVIDKAIPGGECFVDK